MCNLGLCYEYGEGVAEDKTKAAEWYEKAARRGYAPAQCNLGFFYDREMCIRDRRGKARRSRPVKAQLRSSKLAPQLRQLTVIFPFPRGTRRYCPQLGHLK